MKIDLGSFAFGSYLDVGGGNPSWGTALGQSRPDYKFTRAGSENILVGMLYNSVNLKNVTLPLGKGGSIKRASDCDLCHLASIFDNVYINDIHIGYPFIMVMIKEASKSHFGRRSIKYTDKITYKCDDEYISNLEFLRIARQKLGLNWESCWFVYDISVINLNELHLKAVIVNKDYSETYHDSFERKEEWASLIND